MLQLGLEESWAGNWLTGLDKVGPYLGLEFRFERCGLTTECFSNYLHIGQRRFFVVVRFFVISSTAYSRLFYFTVESHFRLLLSIMFCLSLLSHTLRLPPDLLDLPLDVSIRRYLEKLFLDKVIAKLGLCVSVYDLIKIQGGFIDPARGAPTYEVDFRVVMFRPFIGEVLSAKLKHHDSTGIVLTLGFFDDIYVPAVHMQDPSVYKLDSATGQTLWFWVCDHGEFVIDGYDEIRVQVLSVSYPPLPLEMPENSKPFAPMVITCTINGEGLGPLSWWGGGEEGEEEEEQ